MSPPKRYMDVLERSPGVGVRLAGRPSWRNPMRLSGLKALPHGQCPEVEIVKVAATQPGRPDGRPRGCKATGMSPPKRYREVLERSPGTGTRLAGRPFWRQTMRLSGLKPLPQGHPRPMKLAVTHPGWVGQPRLPPIRSLAISIARVQEISSPTRIARASSSSTRRNWPMTSPVMVLPCWIS